MAKCSCTGACRKAPYKCPITKGNYGPWYDPEWKRKMEEKFTVTVDDIMDAVRRVRLTGLDTPEIA